MPLEIVETPGEASCLALPPGLTPVPDRLLMAAGHAGLRIDER